MTEERIDTMATHMDIAIVNEVMTAGNPTTVMHAVLAIADRGDGWQSADFTFAVRYGIVFS